MEVACPCCPCLVEEVVEVQHQGMEVQLVMEVHLQKVYEADSSAH